MSPASKPELTRLLDHKSELVAKMEAMRNKIAGLDLAIGLLAGSVGSSPMASSRTSGVTETLINMLEQTGEEGLNAQTATELALRRGLHLRRQSLSSLLSRLKRQGTVVYEDGRYKLAKFKGVPAKAA